MRPNFTLMAILAAAFVLPIGAQTGDLRLVLERLDRLEKQNQDLLAEIQELRKQIVPTPVPEAGPVEERLEVQESRAADLEQSKVGTLQRLPVTLSGTVLFNAFHNGQNGGGLQYPVTALLNPTGGADGATFRQTIIGLHFRGPDLAHGGKVSGSAIFDLWGGTASPANNLFRVRTATVDLTWTNTTVSVGQDKPIFSPREPDTLAQVGIAPLSGAGNLWNWQPQAKMEQRFLFSGSSDPAYTGASAGLNVQAGVYQTAEVLPASAPATTTLSTQRPAFESRMLFYRRSGARRFEVAPGVHVSSSHVAGQSVSAHLATADWLLQPTRLFAFSGAFFAGTDAAGLGGLRQGFTIQASGKAIPVHAQGGWSQFGVNVSPRVSFHIYGGLEADRVADLGPSGIRRNLVYAGNTIYRLAQNVLASIEIAQLRTDYIGAGTRLNNHYDVALAYLF